MIGVVADRQLVDVPDGFHLGRVIKAEATEKKGFRYLDVIVSVDDVVDASGRVGELRVGYPLNEAGAISPSSMAGELFARFGVAVAVGAAVNEQTLVGRPVQFVSIRRSKAIGGKIYCDVDRGSLKPYRAPQVVA